MEAAVGLIGVALGASLAPAFDWVRQHRTRRDQQRIELLELVAALISVTGDHLIAASATPDEPWSLEIGFRSNSARWRVRLLAPPDVARAADTYAHASETLRKRVQDVGSWDGSQIAAQWDAWQETTEALITAARSHLDR
jgi:hypothetical protein